jgi:Dienelactone hydrolase family
MSRLITYPGIDHTFALPESPSYNKPAASMAYSRSLAVLQRAMGLEFDLSALWDRHLECEFVDRECGVEHEDNGGAALRQQYSDDDWRCRI